MEQRKKNMPRHPLFQVIVAKKFFQDYCPDVINTAHKLRGLDGNKKPIDFSKEDKVKIRQGVQKLAKDLKELSPK